MLNYRKTWQVSDEDCLGTKAFQNVLLTLTRYIVYNSTVILTKGVPMQVPNEKNVVFLMNYCISL
jgi:hypothetical protein